ncbi:AAA_12 domain-containing protein [Rhodovastum atsumiense]|nr:AAA_12 domain-containing protein [Rhodovastum atsumiense]
MGKERQEARTDPAWLVEDTARTLLYWMDVEALTPPQAEEDGETDTAASFVARHVPDRDFPWRDEAFGHPDRRYRHFVRFGVFGKELYQAEIVRALATDPEEDHDTRPVIKGKRFGFAGLFEVGHDGMAIAGSLRLPAFGLAFERLWEGSPLDFDDELETFRRGARAIFDEIVDAYAGADRQVDERFVRAVHDVTAETLTWLRDLSPGLPQAIVRSVVSSVFVEVESRGGTDAEGGLARLRREKPRKAEIPPVDSFYFDDLRLVLRAVRNGNGGLVARYLAGTPERSDCTGRGFVATACTARTHPRARWPAAHSMALMQQLAVDLAVADLADGGLLAVNGPPGTGKTTLLMDLVAAVVARRAVLLCGFADPADAFARDMWNTPLGWVHGLHESLLDHLIVVASSNNGAVENITRELPSAAKVEERLLDGFRFLGETADALLQLRPGEGGDAEEEDSEEAAPVERRAWGLMSAPLGRVANKARFVRIMDAHEQKGPRKGQRAACNVFRQLEEARRQGVDWRAAREDFLRCLAAVEALRAEVAAAEGPVDPDLPARLVAVEAVAAQAAATLRRAVADDDAAEVAWADAKAAFDRADRSVDLAREARPTGLGSLLGWRTARWKDLLAEAVTLRAGAERGLSDAEQARRVARTAHERARQGAEAAETALAELRLQADAAQEAAARLAERHPELVTVAAVAGEPDEAVRQAMLPGSSRTLAEARARLFVSAMRVHFAFVCAAGPELFDRNLRVALDMLMGRPEVQPVVQKAAAHLWATLALVTPVVSTTFASLSRTFPHMGAGSIPWLLLDEAGQAVPHQAVGAVWRARRAVVVGDPFQVEPVVAMDRNADAKLAQRRGVPDRHRATLASAQTLADTASRYGAWVRSHRGAPVWVGCPLRVHRRCVEPMFGISNRLAYAGGMVLARDKAAAEAALTVSRPLLGPSRWIDVGTKSGGPKHFIPEQGAVVRDLVAACLAAGLVDTDGLPPLFVISPFRSVAEELRRLLCQDLAAQAPKERVLAWGRKAVGTVHAFQGRERETVILALGGTSDGAIRWASFTPNILNVAVTRAQRRLYVVGDRARWTAASELVAELAMLPVEVVPVTAIRQTEPCRSARVEQSAGP